MAHIITKDGIPRRNVPDAWLEATARMTEYAVRVSGRHHLAVKIGPGMAFESGTAQFVPPLGEIHISSEVIAPGIKPSDVHPNDELFRARFPLLIGATLHELAHERYSRWTPRDLTMGDAEGRFKGRKSEVLVALEESRIEKRLLRRYATAGSYLPALIFDFLGKEFKGGDDPYSASILLALILGRQQAGTISARDARPFRDILAEQLSDEQIETLLGLVDEYHDLRFGKYDELPLDVMESIANRWLETLGQDPAEEGEGATTVLVMHSEGEGEGEGSGEAPEGSEGSGEEGEGMAERVAEAAAEAKHEKAMDAAEKVGRIRAKRIKEGVAADEERRAQADEVAGEVFKPAVGQIGSEQPAGGRSVLEPREPAQHERAAGTLFARALAKVVAVDPFRTKVPMDKPGKRLRGRAAVQRRVQEAQGRVPTAKQWEGKHRAMGDDVPVTVGLVTDVSGSMNALAEPLAVTSYIVGNGVEKAGGTFASVVFGSKATGVVKAGRKVKNVPLVHPADPWENIKDAMLAIDGELGIVDGEGVRILFVASDGMFVKPEQKAYADKHWPLWESKGVIVIHLDFERGWVLRNASGNYNPRHNLKRMPVQVDPDLDAAQIAKQLGDIVIAEVKKEAARRVAA